ncbi:MAG: universal stress protein [Bacteroidia bacterium]
MNYQKILIAVDDSPVAEKVAAKGFMLGQQLNAEIALLSVVDTAALSAGGGITPKEMEEILKNGLRKSQLLLLDKVFKAHKVWTFIEEGKPYEKILAVAVDWQADLIIIGTHGRTGLAHILMGSVAEHVLRHAKIPVMIIPVKQV